MSIRGERGSKDVDRAIRIAVVVFDDLLVCHSFMWLEELGGSVIVEWYARRR